MYTETVCNVPIKVFFVRRFWQWNACGKFSRGKNQAPNMKQWLKKIEVGKDETKKYIQNISEFWDDKCFSSTMGCFTVAHLTSYLEAKSGSAVASTCPNSWGSHGDGKTKRTKTPSAFARTVLAPSIPGMGFFFHHKQDEKNDSAAASCFITWYQNKKTSLNITTFEDGFFLSFAAASRRASAAWLYSGSNFWQCPHQGLASCYVVHMFTTPPCRTMPKC